MFIDTHAHIFMRDFDADREAVVARARAAGVAAIIDVGLDIETNQAVLEFARAHNAVFPIIGFHPHEASRFDAEAFERQVRAHLDEIVALGEFGLDYAKEYSPRPAQLRAFEMELSISNTVDKPVIIHCREAESDVLTLLRAAGPRRTGVMHCFSGDTDFLEQVLGLGLHISVGGPVTYPKAVKLERVVTAVPRDRLLLETDCPYLAPQARRGKRNEPACIPIIAARIAQIWKTTPEEVGDITTANALALFGITPPALERG
jgi:TatD DNase family protein